MNTEVHMSEIENRLKKLEEENKILKNIIYKAPIPIFVLDKNHTITHFNQALEELSGFSSKNIVGTKEQWRAFYSNPRPVMADLIIDRSSDDEIVEHYGSKYDRSSKDKERFAATDFFQDISEGGKWLFFTASAFTDTNGEIAGAVETLQDVTEEKIASRKTRELYQVYRKILEFVPYPIVVYDDNGLVTYVNPSFSSTFGWTLDELKGCHVPFVPEDLKAETSLMIDKFREHNDLNRYITQRMTKTGKVLDVVLRAASYTDPDSEATQTFVILRDITE